MMAVRSLMSAALLLHHLLLQAFCSSSSSSSSSSAPIGINYGQIADNLPSPETVIPLLRSIGVGRVKLYDADPRVLRAFAGTDVEFVVGLPDQCVPKARDPAAALAWVKANVQPYITKTRIATVTVGNEVLTGNDTALIQSLLPAMQSVHSALASLGLDRRVAVTTAHSLAVLATSYPPSAAVFRRDVLPVVTPILAFLAKTGAPFLINAYPYFAYKADPKRVSLDYVLFQPNSGVLDPASGLRYDNMLHAQVDAVRSAIAAVAAGGGGGKGVEVMVSETGWPSEGDEDEAGATAENARRYNGNLMKMVAEGRGTPMRPGAPLGVYVFALFNENMKPGPASERHYGVFNPDGTPAYQLGVAGSSGNSSSGGGGSRDDGAADSPSGQAGASASTNYYTISSAPDEWRFGVVREAATMTAAVVTAAAVGLVLNLA